jgi:hypothetical protein
MPVTGDPCEMDVTFNYDMVTAEMNSHSKPYISITGLP